MPTKISGGDGSSGPASPAQNTQSASAPTPQAKQDAAAGSDSGPQNAPLDSVDAFEQGTKPPPLISKSLSPPSPYAAKLQKANANFSTKLEKTLNHDALSLAQGKQPWRSGDPLTTDQLTGMRTAVEDYVQDIPIGVMAPKLAEKIEGSLRENGVQVKDLGNQSLRDISKQAPKVARDFAKDLASDFKENSPGAYYGVLAGGIAAAGAVAYKKGTAPLEKLGIKPAFSTGLFHDRVKVKAEASWGAHFSDFRLENTVSGKVDLRHGDVLHLSGTTQFAKGSLEKGQFDTRLSLHNGLDFSGRVGFDIKGINDVRLSSRLALGQGRGVFRQDVGFNRDGLRDIGAEYTLSRSDHRLQVRGQARYNFQDHRATAGFTAVMQPREGMDTAFSFSHDSAGNSYVGVGATWRF
jgi:hypothetical protein